MEYTMSDQGNGGSPRVDLGWARGARRRVRRRRLLKGASRVECAHEFPIELRLNSLRTRFILGVRIGCSLQLDQPITGQKYTW
jgi:hypothetical protein